MTASKVHSSASASDRQAEPVKRDPRMRYYFALNLIFVGFYIVLATRLAPATNLAGSVVEWLLVASMLLAAQGMFLGMGKSDKPRQLAWRMVALGCSLLLLTELLLLILVLLSTSYLAGTYGSFGLGASAMALVVAALSIELIALLPTLQLKFLLSRAGRRAFGLAK